MSDHKASVQFLGVAATLLDVLLAAGAAAAPFSSMQAKGIEGVTVPVDANAAAQRLGKVVKFATISNQDRRDFEATDSFITAIAACNLGSTGRRNTRSASLLHQA